MASSAYTIAEARLIAARAAEAVAQAELKASQADLAVAQAQLELAVTQHERQGGLPSSNMQNPKDSSDPDAWPPLSALTLLTERDVPTTDAPVPISTFANHKHAKLVAAPNHIAVRAGLVSAMSVGTPTGSASAPTVSASDSGSAMSGAAPPRTASAFAGPFTELGRGVRLRAWHICRAGGDGDKCNTFSLAHGWGVNYTTGAKVCCNSQCNAKYRYGFGMIGQFQLQATDYFVRLDCHDWWEADFHDKLVNAVQGAKPLGADARRQFEELRPRKFDSLFRQAQQKDVKPAVDKQATFILLNDCLWDKLPEWTWPLLCGVLKHAICA